MAHLRRSSRNHYASGNGAKRGIPPTAPIRRPAAPEPCCRPRRRNPDLVRVTEVCAHLNTGRHPRRRGGTTGGQCRQHVACEPAGRSEEHTSELQSLMRISYAVFCLKKKKKTKESI